jgi:hypothetical protein
LDLHTPWRRRKRSESSSQTPPWIGSRTRHTALLTDVYLRSQAHHPAGSTAARLSRARAATCTASSSGVSVSDLRPVSRRRRTHTAATPATSSAISQPFRQHADDKQRDAVAHADGAARNAGVIDRLDEHAVRTGAEARPRKRKMVQRERPTARADAPNETPRLSTEALTQPNNQLNWRSAFSQYNNYDR